MSAKLLEVEDLTVEIGRKGAGVRVLESISFSLEAGQSIGIVGESGSGKSMTALALLRLMPQAARIAAGRVRFDGQDLLSLPATAMQKLRGRDIAMVFQEPMNALNPVMRIGAQIGETILVHEPVSAAARRARVLDLFRPVGIPDPRPGSTPIRMNFPVASGSA